jgi:hypothetical protein
MTLTRRERVQLAGAIGCSVPELNQRLTAYAAAAKEEYVRMILGQRVFTRGQDIREYRLLLVIQHVFDGKLPNEQEISNLFQTSKTQSRALLRAVMSKYQYELQAGIRATLRDVIDNAQPKADGSGFWFSIDSENVVNALNSELTTIRGTLEQVGKQRGTVSTYEIAPASHEELKKKAADW